MNIWGGVFFEGRFYKEGLRLSLYRACKAECATFFVDGGGQRQWQDANKFVQMMTGDENKYQEIYKHLLDKEQGKVKHDPKSVLRMLLNNFEDLW